MNTRNSSTPSNAQAAPNPRAKETARRRPALDAIDAQYYAGNLTDTERDFARWQVRKLCETRDYFDVTQEEQAQRYVCPRRQRTLSPRQIKRVNDELEAVGLIWRSKRGTTYRTYITAYVPRPSTTPPADEIVATSPTEEEQQQDRDRTALWLFMAAMQLASADGASFFVPTEGDIDVKELGTPMSPSPSINESDPPKGGIASPVCDAGGGGKDTSTTNTNTPDHEPDEPEIMQCLRASDVRHEATLRQCAAAPARAAEVFGAWQAKGGGPGLFYTMWHHGVWGGWGKCGKHVAKSPALPALHDEDAWRHKYTGGPLAPYIIGGSDDASAPPDDTPPDQADDAPKRERCHRDAEHTLINGWVPPTLQPLPTPPDEDDPAQRKYQHYGGLPQWDEGETP